MSNLSEEATNVMEQAGAVLDETEQVSVLNASSSDEKTVTFLGHKIKGITGSTLKMVAIITMLIDHIAAVIFEPYMYRLHNIGKWDFIYKIEPHMRRIGRIAFPIFCFLLVEGFVHTRSKIKYMIRLVLFCLVSEIPFNLAFCQKVWYSNYQNVFFTLFIGFVTISIIDFCWKHKNIPKILLCILTIAVTVLGMYAAKELQTDYAGLGVITIVIMYLLRSDHKAEIYGGCMTLTLGQMFEAYAFGAMIPVALYNGKRGWKMKYAFYIFYPAHLLILTGIAKIVEKMMF